MQIHKSFLLLLLFLFLFLTGCPTGVSDDDDDGSPADDDTDGDDDTTDPPQTVAYVATSDGSVGALATVALDDWAIEDQLTALTGDTVLTVDGGKLFAINRYEHDSIRIYDPQNLNTPQVEFSTGSGSNPHQALFCDGSVFVTRYSEASLGVYDPDIGLPVSTVDLAPYADDDGIPEASNMVRIGDSLYVGLHRLDRDNGWAAAAGGGLVAQVDCASKEVVQTWTTGNNVNLMVHPLDPEQLLLTDGLFYDENYAVTLDGGAHELAPAADDEVGEYLLTEDVVGGNVAGLAANENGHGILISAEDAGYRIFCLDMTDWSLEELEFTTSYLSDIEINDRGEVFIAARTSWLDPGSLGGLIVYDAETCDSLTGDDWITFSLDPNSVTFR